MQTLTDMRLTEPDLHLACVANIEGVTPLTTQQLLHDHIKPLAELYTPLYLKVYKSDFSCIKGSFQRCAKIEVEIFGQYPYTEEDSFDFLNYEVKELFITLFGEDVSNFEVGNYTSEDGTCYSVMTCNLDFHTYVMRLGDYASC